MSELKISIEGTPNPDALKFVLDRDVQYNGSSTFLTVEDCASVPLAKSLISLKGVQSVFFMGSFITISKKADVPWKELTDAIESTIRSGMTTHDPAIVPQKKDASHMSQDERLMHVEAILEREIRPGLAMDGGGLEVLGLEGNVLKVRYQGACGSCPSSTTGTLNAIQDLLRRTFDENIQVVSEASAGTPPTSPFKNLFKNI